MPRKYFKAAGKLSARIKSITAKYPQLKGDFAALAIACAREEAIEVDPTVSGMTTEQFLTFLNQNPQLIPSTATIRNYLKAQKTASAS